MRKSGEREPVELRQVKPGRKVELLSARLDGNYESSGFVGIVGARTPEGILVRIVSPIEAIVDRELHLPLGETTRVFDRGITQTASARAGKEPVPPTRAQAY